MTKLVKIMGYLGMSGSGIPSINYHKPTRHERYMHSHYILPEAVLAITPQEYETDWYEKGSNHIDGCVIHIFGKELRCAVSAETAHRMLFEEDKDDLL